MRIGLDVAHIGRLTAHLGDDPERVGAALEAVGDRRAARLAALAADRLQQRDPGRKAALASARIGGLSSLTCSRVTSLRLRSIVGRVSQPPMLRLRQLGAARDASARLSVQTGL